MTVYDGVTDLAASTLYEANGGCAREKFKEIKYFLLSWASPEEEFLVQPLEAGEAQLQKVHHHCLLHLV